MTNERSKSRTWTSAPSAFGTATCRTAVGSEFRWSGARASAPVQRPILRPSQGTHASRTRRSVAVPRTVLLDHRQGGGDGGVRRSPLRVLVLAAVLAFAAVVARTGSADARPSGTSTVVHVVVPGDTLWSIARQVSPHGNVGPVIARLVRENGLSTASAVLRPGDALLLPSR